jgi:LysM repeat protein
MSTPNPLIPQGSLLEQQARSKSTFQMAAFIVALHVVVLGGFLFLGCKKEENQAQTPSPTDTLATPPPVVTDTNAPTMADAGLTNAPVEPVTNANLNPVPPPVDPGMSTSTTPPPVVPVTPPPASGAEYVVQKGDSGFIIAKKNGVTLKQLQEANPGKNLAKLSIGAKLNLPAGAGDGAAASVETKPAPAGRESTKAATVKGGESYTVKGGDNLGRLAKKFGVSVKAIRDANGLQGSDIRVGQKLKIPTKAGAPAASSDPAPVTPGDNTPVAPAPVAPAPTALPVVTPAVPAPITPPAPR